MEPQAEYQPSQIEKSPNLSVIYDIADEDQRKKIADILRSGPPETLDDIAAINELVDKDHLINNAGHMAGVLMESSTELREKIDYKSAGLSPEESSRRQEIIDAIDNGDEEKMRQLGLSFEYAWMDDVVATILRGNPPIEIETVGPYAAAHINPETDRLEIDISKVPPDEMAGIYVAAILRKIDPVAHNTRIVSLIDELNNYMTDRDLTPEEQDAYVVAMAEFYGQAGVLKPDDEPGKDFVILRESDLANRVIELEEKLKASGKGELRVNDKGETYFYPDHELVDSLAIHTSKTVTEIKEDGILIRRADGKPTCQAMDASGFLNPINEKFMHVVMLDDRMENQQDKTYALLKVLGTVKQERYHNILFKSDQLDPEIIAYGVTKSIERQTLKFKAALEKNDEWGDFDPFEYVKRNYGKENILPEDEEIIKAVILALKALGIEEGSLKDVADIGSGPNLYPSMLMAPYLEDGAQVQMIEYALSNREYMQRLLDGTLEAEHSEYWHKFEDLMVKLGGESYQGAEEKAKKAATVHEGSIFELPEAQYDLVSSYFVAESIVDTKYPFREALESLKRSLKPGGAMIIAHMVGSEGYHAGFKVGEVDENGDPVKKSFPAVNLSIKDLEETYADADLDFEIIPIGEGAVEKAREGYHGMAVVIARPKQPTS